MRIALVSEHASPLAALGGADAGGQNVHVAALASELAAMGNDVVVHTRRESEGAAAVVELAPGVRVHHVDAGPPSPIPKDDILAHVPALTEGIAGFWRQWQPDVAHAHFWMSGLATLPIARRFGIPLAQTFHALGVVKRRHQGLADTSPRSRLDDERRVATGADRVLATCTDEVAELCRMGLPPARASVVPCGVDTDSFRPDGPVEPRRPGRRLLSVGRLVPRKGVDDAIRALAWVADAELLVAGGPDPRELDGDPEVARLRAVADEEGVADRVEFLGSVGRDRVPALIRSSDAVVACPWYEPFGIVPLEAMACGVPAVVSDVGGMRDTVRHGVTGLRLPPRSPRRLAEELSALLAAPETAGAMGEAGVRRVRERYTWRRVAEATSRAYGELLAAGAQRSVG